MLNNISYIYDPKRRNPRNEWLRRLDKTIAEMLGHRVCETYIPYPSEKDGFIMMEYQAVPGNADSMQLVPYYTSDTNDALALFASEPGVKLNLQHIFNSDQSTYLNDPHKLGEWWVGYEYGKYHYLPGSGSYYFLPEAICRAWFSYMNFSIIEPDWEKASA